MSVSLPLGTRVLRDSERIKAKYYSDLQEGDIIEIPWGIRFVMRDPHGKIVGGVAKKPKKIPKTQILDTTDDVEAGGFEGTEMEGYDDEELEDDEEGDEVEEDPEAEEFEFDDDEDLEKAKEKGLKFKGFYTEPRGPPPPGKPEYEMVQMFEKDKVYYEKDSPLYEISKRLGLKTYVDKDVPVQVKKRVYDMDLLFSGYEKMRVGKGGVLEPYKPFKSIKLIDLDVPVIAHKRPTIEPYKKPEPNPYQPKFSFGTFVSFKDPETDESKRGIILGYTETTTEVAEYITGKIYNLEYANLKLRKRPVSTKIDLKKSTPIDVLDFYDKPVPPKLRAIIVDLYAETMAFLYVEAIKKRKITVKPMHSPPKQQIRWDILNKPKISYEDYYNEELDKWRYANIFNDLVKKAEERRETLYKQAQELVVEETNIDKIIEYFNSLFPDKNFTLHTQAELVNELRKRKDISLLEAFMISELEQSGKEVKGYDVAQLVSITLEKFFRIHPPNVDMKFRQLMDQAILDEFNATEPTSVDNKKFQAEFGAHIKQTFDAYEKEYRAEVKKLKAQKIIESKKVDLEVGAPSDSDVKAPTKEDVMKFEQLVYAQYGTTIHTYLLHALIPYLFLGGVFNKYAKFLKAKLLNGDFNLTALINANLAYLLPELAMNTKLTEQTWEIISDTIIATLYDEINDMITMYYSIIYPSAIRQPKPKTIEFPENIDEWIVDPRKVCFKDSQTGLRYKITEEDGVEKYVRAYGKKAPIAKEDIPDSDLIICMSNDKFVCHSIRDVLRDIARGVKIDKYTGTPYSSKFINKIKQQYAEELQDPSLKAPEPEILPEDAFDDDYEPPPGIKSPPKKVIPKKKVIGIKTEAGTKLKIFASSNLAKNVKKPRVRPQLRKKDTKIFDQIGVINFSTDIPKKLHYKSKEGEKITITTTENIDDTDIIVLFLNEESMGDPKSIRKLIEGVDENKEIYVLFVAQEITDQDKVIKKTRIKKMLPKIKDVIFAMEEEILDAMGDLLHLVSGIEILSI